MGWFLADYLVHQLKTPNLKQYSILDLNPECLIQFRMYFHPKTLKKRKKTCDLSHDLTYSPDDKISV